MGINEEVTHVFKSTEEKTTVLTVKEVGPAGPRGADGGAPSITMVGDQVAVDGIIVGPSLTGPKGDQGERGETGLQGETGPPGTSGILSGTGDPPSTEGLPEGSIYIKYES